MADKFFEKMKTSFFRVTSFSCRLRRRTENDSGSGHLGRVLEPAEPVLRNKKRRVPEPARLILRNEKRRVPEPARADSEAPRGGGMIKARLKQLFKLYALYARMDAQWLLHDTRNGIFCILGDLLSNLAGLSGVFLLAVRFNGVGGLSANEVLLLLGLSGLGDGMIMTFFSGFNVANISRRVGRGQVDHMLIQPVPLWMQLLTEGFLPVTGSQTLLLGGVVTGVALSRLGLWLSPAMALQIALMLIFRLMIQLGLSYLAGSRAFYRPVSCEELSSVVLDLTSSLSKYPFSGLAGWLTVVLVSVLPVGLMAWMPAMVILNKPGFSLGMAWMAAVAVMCAGLGAIFFRKGLSYYGKTGSARYRAIGHRS